MDSIRQAYTTLEQELDALDQRRGEIDTLLAHMRKAFPHLEDDIDDEEDGPAPARGARKTAGKSKRTDGRTEQSPRQARARATRSLPDGTDRGQAILAALKAHGVLSPGELAKHAKFGNIHRLRYHMKPLLKARAIVATGNTANRRISLPGHKPAKEAL